MEHDERSGRKNLLKNRNIRPIGRICDQFSGGAQNADERNSNDFSDETRLTRRRTSSHHAYSAVRGSLIFPTMSGTESIQKRTFP